MWVRGDTENGGPLKYSRFVSVKHDGHMGHFCLHHRLGDGHWGHHDPGQAGNAGGTGPKNEEEVGVPRFPLAAFLGSPSTWRACGAGAPVLILLLNKPDFIYMPMYQASRDTVNPHLLVSASVPSAVFPKKCSSVVFHYRFISSLSNLRDLHVSPTSKAFRSTVRFASGSLYGPYA